MKRTIYIACVAVLLAGVMTLALTNSSAPVATIASAGSHGAVFVPAVASWRLVKADEPPPTEQDCYDGGIRCFVPQSMANAYNYAVLHAAGNQGQGITIAIIDSFGSATIRHDLHVFNQAFGLQPMCGEEGVTCQPGMPSFDILNLQGSPATGAQPPNNGTGQESKFGWAVETSLDVQWAHATAPKANILLVTTPTAETLGVQGYPQMMNALQYIVDNDLADVVSMSFGAGEGSFHSGLAALQQMRQGMIDAKANGVTLLASTGDFGTGNIFKEPVKNPGLIPYPSVIWPASDPLVTAVGGTRLCMDAVTGLTVDTVNPPTVCQPAVNTLLQRETAWPGSGGGYSILFPRPSFQDSLPPGSTFVGSSVGAPPPNNNMRGIPDVAYQASPGTAVLVFVDSFWLAVGGTSASAPQWAGLIAIADQMAGHNLGYINPALYQIANDPVKYAKDFFDVTAGCNQTSPVPGYCASQGWDAVTGLGTPNAANLLPDLVAASP
jgi:subtilase family serine protease